MEEDILYDEQKQLNNKLYLDETIKYTKSVFNKIKLIFYTITGYTFYEINPHFFINSLIAEHKFILKLRYILENYNNKDNSSDTVITIKENMLTKIFILKYCVISICQTYVYNTVYFNTYNYILELKSLNLEYIYNYIIDDNYIIIFSKIII